MHLSCFLNCYICTLCNWKKTNVLISGLFVIPSIVSLTSLLLFYLEPCFIYYPLIFLSILLFFLLSTILHQYKLFSPLTNWRKLFLLKCAIEKQTGSFFLNSLLSSLRWNQHRFSSSLQVTLFEQRISLYFSSTAHHSSIHWKLSFGPMLLLGKWTVDPHTALTISYLFRWSHGPKSPKWTHHLHTLY